MELVLANIKAIDLSAIGLSVPGNNTLIIVENIPDDIATIESQTSIVKLDVVSMGYGTDNSLFLQIPYLYLDNHKIYVYGYVKEDEVILFNDYENPLITGNVEVTYPIDTNVYNENGEVLYNRKDLINKCTFGILYTDNYSQNRFVISGNYLEPNCDWWNDNINVFASSDDTGTNKNLKKDDLLYFPDENYCYYGTNKSKVVAYAVDSNGKLIVFKEHCDNQESTIYFREAVYSDNRYVLNMFSGNVGSAPVSPFGIVNFNGSTIYISNDKTLQLLTTSSNLNDTSKYSQSISALINKYLKEYDIEDFKNARLVYLKDYLYFLIGEDIFVGTSLDGTFEFFRFSSELMKEYGFKEVNVINDSLYFLNNIGEIYEYNEDNEFIDSHTYFLTNSEITDGDDEEDHKVIYVNETNGGNDLKKDDEISFDDSYSVFVNILDNNNFKKISDNKFYALTSEALSLLDMLSNKSVKLLNSSYVEVASDILISRDEEPYEDTNGNIYISFSINSSNSDYMFIGLPKEHFIFKINEAISTKITKITANSIVFDYHFIINNGAKITRNFIINSFYITKPFDFGTLTRYKNIHAFTLTNDTNLSSEMKVSVITNNIPKHKGQIINMTKNKLLNSRYSLSLNDLDFANLSLSQDYVPTRGRTIYRNLFRQKFVCFVLNSDTKENMVLSKLGIIYSIGGNIVGGEM